MKPVGWKTYRTRFLVNAKQLSSSLSFTDNLGRQHCGRKGDYLVESFDGVISIAPRQIFEDIYVPMSLVNNPEINQTETTGPGGSPDRLCTEPLEIERVSLRDSFGTTPTDGPRSRLHDEAVPVRRKFQSARHHTGSAPLRLM